MTIEETQKWFETLNRACIALDIASSNMTKWRQQGYIPWKQQFKLAFLTEGELTPDDVDPYLVRNPKKPKTKKRKNDAREVEISRDSTISSQSNGL